MKNNVFRTIGLAVVAGISLASCNAGNDSQIANNHPAQQLKFGDENLVLKLGTGVYQHTGVATNAVCMKDALKPNKFRMPKGHITLNNRVSDKQLKDELNLSVKGKGGWGTFSASASANFVRKTQDDRYSRNFTYLQDFGWSSDFDVSDFGEDNLTLVAQKSHKAGRDKFLNFCGDSYVNRAYAGALLAVNVKVEFASHKDQQDFDAKVGAGFSFGSFTSSIKGNKLNQSMDATIVFEALQLGGNAAELSSLFQKSQDGDFYIAKCNFKDLDSCNKIITGILNYAQQLPSQVTDNQGNPIQERLFYYNPTITKYSDVGIDLSSPDLSRDVIASQASLQSLVETTYQDLSFVKHYQKSAVAKYFDLEMANFLRNAEKALTLRYEYLLAYGENCYTTKNVMNCPSIVKEANDVFGSIAEYKVDQSKLEYVKTGWYNMFQNGAIYLFAPISLNWDYYSARIAGDGDLSAKITVDPDGALHLYGTRTNYALKFDAKKTAKDRYNSNYFCDSRGSAHVDISMNLIQTPY